MFSIAKRSFYRRFSRTVFRTWRPNSSWNIRVICRQISANIPLRQTTRDDHSAFSQEHLRVVGRRRGLVYCTSEELIQMLVPQLRKPL